jgi:Ca-activated chloride channel family protein
MYDAVSEAVVKLQEGKFSKKAILLITDGNDTTSKKRFGAVRKELQSSDILIYVIGIGHGQRGSYGHGSLVGPGDEVNKKVLENFTKDSGGRTYIVKGAHVVKGRDVIDEAALAVAKDLYYQYVLAYVSSNDSGNGGWRKIKVKVKDKKFRVLARRGYR